MNQEPFPHADDYDEPDHSDTSDSTPPVSYPPMTVPQRLFAVERQQIETRKEVKALSIKVDRLLKVASWKNSVKKVGYPVLTAAVMTASQHFPQFKDLLSAILSALGSAQ